MEKSVPIFQLKYEADFRELFNRGCERIFDEGFLSNHTYVRAFENSFQKFLGNGLACAVNSGTAALEVVLRAIDVKGKKVILPTNTFIASALAVIHSGGIPVLVDIERESLGLDLGLASEIGDHQTRAVMAVHTGGIVNPQLIEFRQRLPQTTLLIEDCAHAHGSYAGQIPAGLIGHAAAFSFHLTKTISSGEGGMAVTQDETLFDIFKSIRQFGRTPREPLLHDRLGNNFKMTEFQGLLGHLELELRSAKRIQKRQALAKLYEARLKNTPWKTYGVSSLNGHYKLVCTGPVSRDVVRRHFNSQGIALTGGVYDFPLHRQPILKDYVKGEYPRADWFSQFHFCPPCYPELEESDVERIVGTLLSLAQD
ncbi:MAG: DegT/DnrJ/EryC1/StrS family aminotransferase [Oligoflexia bacterium]|nr:DegT/DnrJ/EryC1/StrS family aminotransferase [Oligoflexia bacterium]